MLLLFVVLLRGDLFSGFQGGRFAAIFLLFLVHPAVSFRPRPLSPLWSLSSQEKGLPSLCTDVSDDFFLLTDKMAMNPVGSLRRRPGLVGLLIAIPCIIILLTSSPDMTSEHALAERLADLQMKLQQFNSMHRAQREEVQVNILNQLFVRRREKVARS